MLTVLLSEFESRQRQRQTTKMGVGMTPWTEGALREWSLITGRGGLQNGRGGHVKFYPYEKGGAEKVLAILKGGGTKSFGVDFTR